MTRSVSAFALSLLLCHTAVPVSGLAQAKAAGPAPAAPAGAGKWVSPVKGPANVQVIRIPGKKVGKEMVSSVQVKNTSTGSINLLRVEELWYDQGNKLISSGTSLYRKPFLPGEVITLEVKSPLNGQPYTSQLQFAHANGSVMPKVVRKFE